MQIECSICYEPFTGENTEDVCATYCGHLFHEACLKDWSSRSKTCPQCRAVLQNDNRKLYLGLQTDSQNDTTEKHVTEHLSDDEIKRVTELKATVNIAIESMQKLLTEIDNISSVKSVGKKSITLSADIRRKLFTDTGNAGGSTQVNLRNTEKKISEALSHITVFEEKMFVANKSLIDLAEKLKISRNGSGDWNKVHKSNNLYSSTHVSNFESAYKPKKNIY